MIVYISGPIRSKIPGGRERNIKIASDVARALWKAGIPNHCPHLNTLGMEDLEGEVNFIDGDLEILSRFDAILMVGAWHDSKGAREELRHAWALGLKDFYSVEDCIARLTGKGA